MGFERAGYCVVRGPDTLWGQSITDWHALPGVFEGVIGGPPCQFYSSANRTGNPRDGDALVIQFLRVVTEARPVWFLMENVPRVPDVLAAGYTVQRFNVRANEFNGKQRRLRTFQFGYRDRSPLVVPRAVTVKEGLQPAAMATDAFRRGWVEHCALQGIPPLSLKHLSIGLQYRLVGNGVPVYVAEAVARAIRNRVPGVTLCRCGCARAVTGRRSTVDAACRQRIRRSRDGTSRRSLSSVTSDAAGYPSAWSVTSDAPAVTAPGHVTAGTSRQLDLVDQVKLLEKGDCSTAFLEESASAPVGITTAAPRQVIPGCKSQPGI